MTARTTRSAIAPRRRTPPRVAISIALACSVAGVAGLSHSASAQYTQPRKQPQPSQPLTPARPGGSSPAQPTAKPAPAPATRQQPAPSTTDEGAPAESLLDFVKRESERVLSTPADADAAAWKRASSEADALLLRVAMCSDPRREAPAWTDAARTALIARLVAAAGDAERADAAKLLTKYPDLATDVAFLINDDDDRAGAIRTILALHAKFAERIADYPALVAAIAAVRDRPLAVRANENTKQAPPVETVFAYFVGNQGKINADLKNGPPEALAFVVDETPDPGEMAWALDRYAGNPQVGLLYGSIQYDDEHFLEGRPKRLTTEGFSLQNIARVGGVCVDQAYFASMVGKAIGVPTVMVYGEAETGTAHCWVGYIRGSRGRGQWDMSQGRYDEAKFLSGQVRDPRSGKLVSEAVVGVQEKLFSTPSKDVRLARACIEAARLVGSATADPAPITIAKRSRSSTPAGGAGDATALAKVRERGPEGAEGLLRTALQLCPAMPELWSAVADAAATMDQREMGFWIDAASKIAGGPGAIGRPGSWPEFTFAVTEALLDRTKDDMVAAQAWDRVFSLYQARPDLALRARVELAQRAVKAGQLDAAYRSYEDAIKRFAGQGPYVLDALDGAGKLLKGRGAAGASAFLDLAAYAWQRAERPVETTIAFDQSVWARVGKVYADALLGAGKKADADAVLGQIESARPKGHG